MGIFFIKLSHSLNPEQGQVQGSVNQVVLKRLSNSQGMLLTTI